ncbi:hypothetical protein [Achromobacter sp. UMC71]|uniref:hypothetical protein n=1 Tax=Achromobacter sp. UMC71 TaxID=1862320 RepID=UPI0016006E9E|nr:hypothetical protein [Achromobacter sp. UMC71]MBB1624331.1 hypothetical protein [Achromobacter sp. UMC71]
MTERITRSPCPECGQPQVVSAQGMSLIARCPACGWMVATTNPDHPFHDRTPYTLRVAPGGLGTAIAIARLSAALGTGVKHARDLVAQHQPVAENILAHEVIRLHQMLSQQGLQVTITPDFPWPLDGRSVVD